jgi:bifunctional non-homologous end joining protein LigD
LPLEKYRKMRSADATPEPFGKGGGGRPHLFVVQKHAARRLHYDFRLEWGGVLRSWAVPQGPSPDPSEKRLAVETEDHPVEYADFEGVIPHGNYGAGESIVWDRGRWAIVGDPEESLEKGKILFDLYGYKLRGRWTLVRMKTKGRTTGREWLLIKERDGHVRRGDEAVYPQESILSGLTVEDLQAGKDRAAEIRSQLERLNAPRRRVAAADVDLMLAESRTHAFHRAGWAWELKYDGFRMLAEREGGDVRLLYRRGSDSAGTYPDLARAMRALPFERFLADGEVAVLDEASKPSFGLLQQRALLTRAPDVERAAIERPAVLFLFDLLGFEDFDLRTLPLAERKRLLRMLVPRSGPIRFAEDFGERGDDLLASARELGLEGVVGKKLDAPYRGGRNGDWVKVRIDRSADFAVVGYTKPDGVRTGFGALHLAHAGPDGFVYAGRVGGGFTEKLLDEITGLLAGTEVPKAPCTGTLPTGRGHAWVAPRLVCEVRYKEITREGLLRQPLFLRLRSDKRVEECVRESGGSGLETSQISQESRPDPVPDRVVPFSNLKKVFWPDEGYTKGDLIDYYREISPWLLPWLKDRPIVMTRYPDGIHGKSFFQKDAPSFAPDWVRLERMWSEHAEREIDYFVCGDVETLLFVANLASIPLHVWSSRVASAEKPDYCILDLDPKGAPFSHVIEVAQCIHALCDEIGMPNFIKTSGATGLHVLLPLGAQCTYLESRTLGEILAKVVERELPEIATTARMIADRGGKVYVDYLQNGHGKTIAGTFSARPVAGATCSAPLEWREVNTKLDPRKFTLKTLPARMKKMKSDPCAPVLALRPSLPETLARLTERLRAAG